MNDTSPDCTAERRQFTLGDMLIFFLLCAVYFSQMWCYSVVRADIPAATFFTTVLITWGGWLLFAWYYHARHFERTLVFHCSFPVAGLCACVIVLPIVTLATFDLGAILHMVWLCFVIFSTLLLLGNTLSFLACVFGIMLRGFSIRMPE